MTDSARRPELLVAWILAAAVTAVDQLTKSLAVIRLSDGAVDVVWTLKFRLTYNTGMAFGAGSSLGPVIAVGAFVIVMALARSVSRQPRLVYRIAVGTLVGGATGNLLDRIFRSPGVLRGAVVDFIDFGWFPVFNIADIAINVGAGLLILTVFLDSRRGRSSRESGIDDR
ncbi:MAG TPA: signal peptidase II [Acidimicrobiaceae bacterium]|nr:signal peptidase II [Acidimicrobiaceae bacterium]